MPPKSKSSSNKSKKAKSPSKTITYGKNDGTQRMLLDRSFHNRQNPERNTYLFDTFNLIKGKKGLKYGGKKTRKSRR